MNQIFLFLLMITMSTFGQTLKAEKINFEKIKMLNPYLIIGNKEENEKGQV